MAIVGIILLLLNPPLTVYVVACWLVDDYRTADGEPSRFNRAAWLFPLALAAAGIALILHS